MLFRSLPGSQTIIVAGDQSPNMYRSDDAGLTWRTMPSPGGMLTGCVQAGICGVYVQNDHGLFTSSDLVKWTTLGGPGSTFDTRFFVSSFGVYAGGFDYTLYYMPPASGAWPTLDLKPNAIQLSQASGCQAARAKALFTNLSCGTLTIQSATITDTSAWHLGRRIFPMQIMPGDTVQFDLSGFSQNAGTHIAQLRLHLQTLGGATDTIIPLELKVLGILPPTIRSLTLTVPSSCTDRKSTRLNSSH